MRRVGRHRVQGDLPVLDGDLLADPAELVVPGRLPGVVVLGTDGQFVEQCRTGPLTGKVEGVVRQQIEGPIERVQPVRS